MQNHLIRLKNVSSGHITTLHEDEISAWQKDVATVTRGVRLLLRGGGILRFPELDVSQVTERFRTLYGSSFESAFIDNASTAGHPCFLRGSHVRSWYPPTRTIGLLGGQSVPMQCSVDALSKAVDKAGVALICFQDHFNVSGTC